MVTIVSDASVLSPSRVAVTVTSVAASPSAILSLLSDRVMLVGVPSSSVIMVVTDLAVPLRDGAGPPPPCALEIANVNVSSGSSRASSMVATVTVLSAPSDWVKVSVPEAAV